MILLPGVQAAGRCVQRVRPQADACMQSMEAVGQALIAALGEHGSSGDLQALRAANEQLYQTRQGPAACLSCYQELLLAGGVALHAASCLPVQLCSC